MENQEENLEPPGPQTRRASKAREEAKKLEEQRIFDELPHVMMVGLKEKVRQRGADKVHDEGRLQMNAILRGESDGGIKEEVVEEEELDEGNQELDALQQGDEVGDGDVTIKEEVSEGEEMLGENPVDKHVLAEGQAVAIPIDLLEELEVKEEEQGEECSLVISESEGGGVEQEPILLNDEDEAFVADEVGGDHSLIEEDQPEVAGEELRQDEAVDFEEVGNSGQSGEARMELCEDIAAGEGELDEVEGDVNRGKGGAEGGQEGQDVVPGFEEVVNAMQGKEVNVDEDVATGEGVDESNAGQSFVDDAEVQVAVVEKVFFYLASGINF